MAKKASGSGSITVVKKYKKIVRREDVLYRIVKLYIEMKAIDRKL